MPAHGQVGRVDLEEEPGLDDGVIFLLHHVCDREQESFFVLVVLVDHILGQGARRNSREERLDRLDCLKCRLKVVDLRLHRGLVLPPDRSYAHHAAGVQGATFRRLEVWEVRLVARHARRHALAGDEASETVFHVVGESRFPLLAVTHHVHTSVDLLAHDLCNSGAHPHCKGLLIVGLAVLLDPHHLQQVCWPGQTPRMRGEDAMGAVLHSLPSFACAALDCSPLSLEPIHCTPHLLHNLSVASRAPSARAWNLAQTISGWRRPPSPQSVHAITFSRRTRLAYRTRRSATSSGCSTRLVAWAMTPGIRILPSGSCTSCHTFHSCSWHTLAASIEKAWAWTFSTMSMASFKGTSTVWGPFQLPQHIWCRTRSSGMPLRAGLRASTRSCASLRYSSSVGR